MMFASMSGSSAKITVPPKIDLLAKAPIPPLGDGLASKYSVVNIAGVEGELEGAGAAEKEKDEEGEIGGEMGAPGLQKE